MKQRKLPETSADDLLWMMDNLPPFMVAFDRDTGEVVGRTGRFDELVREGTHLSHITDANTEKRITGCLQQIGDATSLENLNFLDKDDQPVPMQGRLRTTVKDDRTVVLITLTPRRRSTDITSEPAHWMDATRQPQWIGDLTRTVFVNPPLEDLLDVRQSGIHLLDCCLAAERDLLRSVFEEVMDGVEGEERGPIDMKFRTRSGDRFLRVLIQRSSATGEPLVRVMFLDDANLIIQYEQERYLRKLDELQHRYAHIFAGEGWDESRIRQLLEESGLLLNASRAFVYQVFTELDRVSVTHEWASPGVEPGFQSNQYAIRDVMVLFELLKQLPVYALSSPDELPEHLVRTVHERGAKAFVLSPILLKGQIVGAIEFSEVRFDRVWSYGEQQFVRSLADQLSMSLERRHLKQELETAHREARESNTLKDKFLSTISHEVRNPLNAIIGLSTILQKQGEGRLTADEQRMISYIRKGGEKLLGMMEDVLFLSKLKQADWQPQRAWCNVTELMFELETYMKGRLYDSPAVRFVLEMEELPHQAWTDGEILRRILMNLLDNAVKFTPAGSISLNGKACNGKFCFAVKDTGIGIPKRFYRQIFREFFQVDDVTTRRFEGVGVGLSIVRLLSDALGGSVDVTSEPNKGTVFSVTIPGEKKETST